MRPRIHLATCDHCGRRIAWSRRRRQWLALNPVPGPTQLQRRMRCPKSDVGLHDPAGNLAERVGRLIFGEDATPAHGAVALRHPIGGTR